MLNIKNEESGRKAAQDFLTNHNKAHSKRGHTSNCSTCLVMKDRSFSKGCILFGTFQCAECRHEINPAEE